MSLRTCFTPALLVGLAFGTFGCGGSDGPVAIPPGTNLNTIKADPNATGATPLPIPRSSKGAKGAPGPLPPPGA